jgi:hypothetical protein
MTKAASLVVNEDSVLIGFECTSLSARMNASYGSAALVWFDITQQAMNVICIFQHGHGQAEACFRPRHSKTQELCDFISSSSASLMMIHAHHQHAAPIHVVVVVVVLR